MNENPSIGPWYVLDGDTACIVNAHDTIARCVRFDKQPYKHRANARMIAAAPEMLAALMRIVDIKTCDEIVSAFEEAKKAIAKATGGEV